MADAFVGSDQFTSIGLLDCCAVGLLACSLGFWVVVDAGLLYCRVVVLLSCGAIWLLGFYTVWQLCQLAVAFLRCWSVAVFGCSVTVYAIFLPKLIGFGRTTPPVLYVANL